MTAASKPVVLVTDVETTMNGTGSNKASPFDKANTLVMVGYQNWATHPDPVCIPSSRLASVKPWGTVAAQTEPWMLVGQNIAFDLHYLRRFGLVTPDLLKRMMIWDTQLAEYLISGQQMRYASLDELTLKYVGAGATKDPTITALFASGKGAEHADPHTLARYLAGDLGNTRIIAEKQMAVCQEMGIMPLVQKQMLARLATIEMEYNGMAVDLKLIERHIVEATKLQEIRLRQLKTMAASVGLPDFNPGSLPQLRTVLYGGTRKEDVFVENGFYKNGKAKLLKKELVHPVAGLGLKCASTTLDDTVLKNLATEALSKGLVKAESFIGLLRGYRETSKQLSTYWEGVRDAVKDFDGRVHPTISHVSTVTGRLSCSAPNLQNITNGDIKKAFVSRFGGDGYIIEADYKQLEMVELAELTKDERLLKDLRDGIDMHEALYESMYKRKLTKEVRKSFKRCSFALIYGAGAKGIAEQGGITLSEARKFIIAFYTRYPGVQVWHQKMQEDAAAARVSTPHKTQKGYPAGEAVLTSPSGRRYVFREYDGPEWKPTGFTNFSPTELKNYFVQGGATGDKVPMGFGALYRELQQRPHLEGKVFLINTVHDSVMLDCHKDVLQEVLTLVKETLESVPEIYQHTFGIELSLPLVVELSFGCNWHDQVEVKYNPATFLWEAK